MRSDSRSGHFYTGSGTLVLFALPVIFVASTLSTAALLLARGLCALAVGDSFMGFVLYWGGGGGAWIVPGVHHSALLWFLVVFTGSFASIAPGILLKRASPATQASLR